MFVLPPPVTMESQVPEKKMNATDDDMPASSPYQFQQGRVSCGLGSISEDRLPLPSAVFDGNFFHSPIAYQDCVRTETHKRLLANRSKPSQSNPRSNVYDMSLISDASSYESDSTFSTPNLLMDLTVDTSIHLITEVSLQDALPRTFYDMYDPKIMTSDPGSLLPNGRPKFTKRELLDWELNDIRSLLLVEKLRPEWGGSLPRIISPRDDMPQFRLQYLPLCSSDTFIIESLVSSDLYAEVNLDYEFRLASAKYTVVAARTRHEQQAGKIEPTMQLSKPEWRNIIENYLLNIAVEAQCRFDFKQKCSEFKKGKQRQLQQRDNLRRQDMPPPSFIPPNSGASLLKRALLKNFQKNSGNNGSAGRIQGKVILTKQEKNQIWSMCQAKVYQRLGLDWVPDNSEGLGL